MLGALLAGGVFVLAQQPNNLIQVGGTAIALGQTTMAASIPVAIASNQGAYPIKLEDGSGNAITSTSSALDINIKSGGSNSVTDAATQSTGATSVATVEAYTLGYDSTNTVYTRIYADPCQSGVKTYTPISLTASGQVLAGTSAKKTYVCHLDIVSATAQNIALVEGTGTVCATSIAGMAGGTTAATGWNFAANGGINLGNGASSVAAEATNADNICLLLSSTGQTSGVLVTAVR